MLKSQIDIEKLVTWALRDQGLGWAGSGRAADIGGDIAMLGTRVDISPSSGLPAPGIGLNDNDDALIVKAAVDRLPPEAAAVVVTNGRIGMRPGWGEEGYGKPAQMVNKRGQPQWEYRDPKNRRGKLGPKLDWRAYESHVAQIDYERATWAVWREALAVLARELGGNLSGFTVTGPMAPAEPWARLSDDGPVPVPFRGSIAELRARAADPIRQLPTDTGIPERPIERKDRRKPKAGRGSGSSGENGA